MSEKEKILSQSYFNDQNLKQVKERLRAKQLGTKFNELIPSENDNTVE